MNKTVHTDKAPKALGPYSQAIKSGNMLFTSGQLGIDAATGGLVSGIVSQTEKVLENLRFVLECEGYSFADVVKTTVFLSDMNNFALMNEIYAKCFISNPPARSTIEVARLPKNALVEIEIIAVK